MIAALFADFIWPFIALIGAGLFGLVMRWIGKREGRKDANTEHEINGYNEYIATKARIDAAFTGADPDAVRDGLRNRDPNKR